MKNRVTAAIFCVLLLLPLTACGTKQFSPQSGGKGMASLTEDRERQYGR